MPAGNRTVDLLVGAFDLNQRRKFELKNADGKKIVDLYFKPITRADRKKAQQLAGTDAVSYTHLTLPTICSV